MPRAHCQHVTVQILFDLGSRLLNKGSINLHVDYLITRLLDELRLDFLFLAFSSCLIKYCFTPAARDRPFVSIVRVLARRMKRAKRKVKKEINRRSCPRGLVQYTKQRITFGGRRSPRLKRRGWWSGGEASLAGLSSTNPSEIVSRIVHHPESSEALALSAVFFSSPLSLCNHEAAGLYKRAVPSRFAQRTKIEKAGKQWTNKFSRSSAFLWNAKWAATTVSACI